MHNLEFNQEKGTISFATNQVAWHKLGVVVDGAMTTEEAIEKANLGFNVYKEPLKVTINGQDIIVPESYATIREDNNAILGTVGEKYEVLQNKEAFQFFDPILEKHEAFIETAGVLGKGERIFISAKLPDHITIFGKEDVIEQNLLITSSHDGKSATTVMFTPIRVVCQNTLNAALRGKLNRISIKHTSNQLTRVHNGSKILGLTNQYKNEIEEIFGRMADTRLTEDDYEKIIVKGLADTNDMVKKYFDPKAKQSTRFRGNVKSVMDYAFSHPTQLTASTNMTAFGAYNAITGWYQNEVDWKNDNDNKMRSIIDTNGRVNLKQQQAFDAALTFIKK